MDVLVTGGTGFVGSNVLNRLAQDGHRIRLVVRQPSRPDVQRLAKKLDARLFAGDVRSSESLQPAMTGADAVVHLVGIISEFGANTFEAVHQRATANVLAAARSAGVPRVVHMSALGTRPNARSRYHQSKWAGEESVRTSPVSWTIFRPSLIFGRGDHFVTLFSELSRWLPALPVMGDGANLLQPIPARVVAECFVRALTESHAIGKTIELCGLERLSLVQVLRVLLEVLGRNRRLWHVPLPLARCLAGTMEVVFPAILRRPSPLNRDQLVMLQEDNVGDPRQMIELFHPQLGTFREGLADSLTVVPGAGTPIRA